MGIKESKIEVVETPREDLTVEERLTILEQRVDAIKVRDRGPKSSRSMTQEDATKVQKGGDLCEL